MPDPTPDQRTAIRSLERNLLVSAGAGSGKTWVLVSRFLRMVAGDSDAPASPTAPVDGVLTITFTDKAAGEMRERIADALVARGLEEERRQLEVAYISTIHGFCRRLLQENPFEAALDPQFAVLDKARADLLLEECFEEVVERAFAENRQETMALVLACQESPDRQALDDPLSGLRVAVLKAMDAMRALGWEPADLQRWVDEGVEGVLRRTAGLVVEPFRELWAQAVEMGRSLGDWRLTGPAEESRRAVDNWARAATAVSPDEGLAELAARAEELRALLPSTGTPRQRREHDPRAFSAVRETLPAIRALIQQPLITEFFLEREQAAAQQSVAFLRIVLATWQGYDAGKEALSALDFNDLQNKARRLLESSEGIRRRYQRKFRYVMVDEFQDTDRLQKSIVDLLHRGDNLFVVGDVKQSIYGWRNADVRLFLELDREYTARQEQEPERYGRVGLADNFRSRPEILAFVNRIFSEVWGTSPGAIPFEELRARGAFAPKEAPSIELLLVPGGTPAADRRAAEADLLARRIVAMHGTLPLTSARRKSDTARWSDFLILLRSFTQLATYEKALGEHSIPYFVVGGRGYYARREIRDLVCLLRVIGSPLDDVATAAVLRSPFVGASPDVLAVLAREAKKLTGIRSLFNAIPKACEDLDLPADEGEALRRFYEMVLRLRKVADRLKPGWLLDRALAETQYDARVLALPDGRRRLANVRKLVQIANTFASPDVAGLVRHLESLTEISADEGDAPAFSEASDVVRVMSIHKAKGLEAPVVFLPDLGRPSWHPPAGLVGLDAGERLIGMKVLDRGTWKPSLALSLLDQEQADRESAEEQRLLYVAMTRAQEHLALVGPMPPGSRTWGEVLYGGRFPLPGLPTEPQILQLAGIEDVWVRVEGAPGD